MSRLANPTQASRIARRILISLNQRILASRGPGTVPGWCIYAKPYLLALAQRDYGLEDPASCVLYALNNLTQWRGAEARECKKLLAATLSDSFTLEETP